MLKTHFFASVQTKQDRFTTCFKTCGTKLFFHTTRKDVKCQKRPQNMISTSKRQAKHLFAGWNTQQACNKTFCNPLLKLSMVTPIKILIIFREKENLDTNGLLIFIISSCHVYYLQFKLSVFPKLFTQGINFLNGMNNYLFSVSSLCLRKNWILC